MKTDVPSPIDLIRLVEPDNLDVATHLAREKLATLDPLSQANRCGAVLHEGHVELVYLGTPLRILVPDWTVHLPDGSPLNPYEQVLVLHYISSDSPVPPPTDPIAFSEVPSGEFYSSAFDRRAKKPLLEAFGENPDRALAAAAPLGGTRADHGDLSIRIPALPRVDLILAFWKGDDEFPPDVSLLLSSTIAAYLSTEDIAHLAGITAFNIIKESSK